MKFCCLFLLTIIIQLSCQAQQIQEILTATIIGSGSPVYSNERAGPSVLIKYKNTSILVDMGNGTQANLAKLGVKIRSLDGLLFTHHHLDHNEEFIPIFINALLGGNSFTIAGPQPTSKYVTSILDIYNEDISYRLGRKDRKLSDITNNYAIKELESIQNFAIGGINISSTKVNHTISTYAYRFDAGGQSIVISGDLTYSEYLPLLAKNADYLIIDSGVTSKSNRNTTHLNTKNEQHRAHLNSEECGQMAKAANVKNLVLTHITRNSIDTLSSTKALNKHYQGNIIFGRDLLQLPINSATGSQKKITAEISKKPTVEHLFSKIDINNDQLISKQEAKGKLKENFSKRDKNEDGFISKAEITR